MDLSNNNNLLEQNFEWPFNWIGRFWGKRSLSFVSDRLALANRSATPIEYKLLDCNEFATFSSGIFGTTLKVDTGKTVIKFRFLRNSGAEEFTDTINGFIAIIIEKSVSRFINEFNSYVVNQYPRDSWIERISKNCSGLFDRYNNQKKHWDKYLNPVDIDKIKNIINFHPTQANSLRDHHENIQLNSRKSFFDQVESNPLTHEQRLGVLRSNDLNLVLAAAGTGKTSVMVAKALDIIDRGLALPSEVLVLAYNRAAAEELQERLKDKSVKGSIDLQSEPHISTFHALGRKILRESGIPTHMSVFTEDTIKLKQWVTGWLTRYLLSSGARMLSFMSLFPEPVNPFDFKTQAEYERYVRDNEFRTLNGEKVKGYQELQIANFLAMNGVQYKYEPAYVSKRRIDVGFDYRPDFHVTDTNVYIEHFGVDRKGNTRPDIDRTRYNESMKKKRALHLECGTKLIETFHYEWCEGTLDAGLASKLEAEGVEFKEIDLQEIFEKLKDEGLIATWSDLLLKALQAIRVERLTHEAILSRLKNAKISQPKKVASILDALHQGYVQELKDQNSIDFDDMIIRAIEVVETGEYIPQWKYVLVDEFQDISAARMEFVQAIVDKGPSPSLTVVGDDWQSIYRFSGGKLELTTRFEELVGSHTLTKLQKTFRYNNSISKTAGQFIMENLEQYKKHIETHDKVTSPQVYLLDDKVGIEGGLYERVKEVVEKIRENDSECNIAIIARYNYLLNECRSVLKSERIQDRIDYWTFHGSKGLEADYCVLIGFFQGKSGFPNENRDEAIVEALLPTLDSYPHSEERRLLYVGITRAKKKSYIIANPTAPSEFVSELLAPKYDLNIFSQTFQEQYRKIYKCPNCVDGYLRLVSGPYGHFYSCSTGQGCTVGKARVCSKCGAPSIDGRNASICNNIACHNTMKICDVCGRPMRIREGRFGRFWGCSGYGIKDDQCRNTNKL